MRGEGGATEIAIGGVVQGVGFRPYVHRLAMRHGLSGWVRNEAGAVRIHAEGAQDALRGFTEDLPRELPPLARLDSFVVDRARSEGLRSFRVVGSETAASGRLPVSPDVATCPACEAELRDPSDRRHGYPFITCTDCGPRFTVIEAMPYDRVRTTMRAFVQCERCSSEYGDPSDRRYHSETNSCSACGPGVWLVEAEGDASGSPHGKAGRESDAPVGTPPEGGTAIAAGADRLLAGRVLAIRGLGGFHLAVRADSEEPVRRLRHRKAREAKPLAVMVRDLADARRLAHLSEAEAAQLTSPERPIVVVRRRIGAELAGAVSPGLDSVGIMLAYTPLHHLLLDAVAPVPLVMTSGNASDEPIAIGNGEAMDRLSGIADAFLLHDREIVARYDDSVLRLAAHGPIVLRRSRGYAPMPLTLPVAAEEPVLAVGPHLKNTFTLADGRDAWLSQHVGDLETLETRAHFEDARRRFESLFHLRPRWVVRDLHPGYLSTRIAEESGLEELPPVQHHHAHVAAVMGEHGREEPVLGLAFDGTGYGSDGRVWGCELLVADLEDFRRVAHLRYAPLPGGDRAARAPWRSLLGYAALELEPSEIHGPASAAWLGDAFDAVDPTELEVAAHQITRSLNAPLASSMGRLFDAAAALLGIRAEPRYEGQAAMELEAAAGVRPGRTLPFPVRAASREPPTVPVTSDEARRVEVLDPLPLLRALGEARRTGRPVADLAADFHETVATAAARLASDQCEREGLDTVALGGGCMQNARLTDALRLKLAAHGLRVLFPRVLSPNDGAVSYGQAVVATARLAGASDSARNPRSRR